MRCACPSPDARGGIPAFRLFVPGVRRPKPSKGAAARGIVLNGQGNDLERTRRTHRQAPTVITNRQNRPDGLDINAQIGFPERAHVIAERTPATRPIQGWASSCCAATRSAAEVRQIGKLQPLPGVDGHAEKYGADLSDGRVAPATSEPVERRGRGSCHRVPPFTKGFRVRGWHRGQSPLRQIDGGCDRRWVGATPRQRVVASARPQPGLWM